MCRPLCPTAVRRKLRPDILNIENMSPSLARPGAGISSRVKGRATVHIIEVGYVSESSDTYLERIQQKREQHASLCTALASAGWRIHNNQPTALMLGQAGTVFSEWQDVLKDLGVTASRADTLMRSLHVHALRYAYSINTQRLKLERGPNGT